MSKALGAAAGALAIAVSAAPAFAQGKAFPDVPPEHWAAQSVKLLADRGIVIGYPDGTYGGPKAMTRYEFAEAIARLLPQIDQAIQTAMEHIPNSPPPDLSKYVTQDQLDQRLGNYYTKPEADARFATKADIDRIMGLLNQFRDELAALGVDVNALKRRYADLEARVTELERLKVFGSGTVALKVSNQYTGFRNGQQYAGVDRDGALLDNGLILPTGPGGLPVGPVPGVAGPASILNPGGSVVPAPLATFSGTPGTNNAPAGGTTVPTPAGAFLPANANAFGKHGVLTDPKAYYDTQIGIQYRFTSDLRAVAQFVMGNYYGAWNEQQAFNASFNSAISGSASILSNRAPGSLALQTYEAYLTAPFQSPVFPHALTNSGISVGRIPTKMTPLTWWAVDPDSYINIPREDSGNITLTGAAVSGTVNDFSINFFGGYDPTDGTSPYTFTGGVDPSRDGTIGFGHYVRPGGSQTFGLNYGNYTRTHLDPNYYKVPTLTSVGGLRVAYVRPNYGIGLNYVAGTGDDWRSNNPGFQSGPAGFSVPLFNRFGSVASVDWNGSLSFFHALTSVLPTFSFQGEIARSNTNDWGAFGVQSKSTLGSVVPSSQGTASDIKIGTHLGSVAIGLQGRSYSPGYEAPGSWGQLGSWINPWNYTSDSPFGYIKFGRGSGTSRIPFPSEININAPFTDVPIIGELGFSVHAGVGHMIANAPGFPTPVGPTSPLVNITDPDRFRITNASAALSFGAGKNSGWKFGLSAEDVLRDYPASGGFKRDATFLWDALKNLVNLRGGTGAHQIAPAAGEWAGLPEANPATSQLGSVVGIAGPPGIQSDENYYQFSVGKNLNNEGTALAKLLFQRIVYTDRTGNAGGSYRGNVGALQLTYRF